MNWGEHDVDALRIRLCYPDFFPDVIAGSVIWGLTGIFMIAAV